MKIAQLKTWMNHPLTRRVDIDDPTIASLRRRIIQEKDFLRKIYLEWYGILAESLPVGESPVLELGSGGGFLSDFIPGLITSEILYSLDVDSVLDGQKLPFKENTFRGIVMVNVLHHLPHVRQFFSEAARCVQIGGVVTMLEPWVTTWSQLIYHWLHHEPFQPEALNWDFETTGPLSGANGALAWIVFQRDYAKFEQEFPEWKVQSIKPSMPFRYLLSGGVSLRSFMPARTFEFWRLLERKMEPWMEDWGMFAHISLLRV